MALQVCTVGKLRTTLRVSRLLAEAGQLHRLLVAPDTPTGSGVMPLGGRDWEATADGRTRLVIDEVSIDR